MIQHQTELGSRQISDKLSRFLAKYKTMSHWHTILKWANPRLFFIHCWSFQTNNTIFTANQCEKCQKVHPVYGARIGTHNVMNMSRHP